MNAFLAIITVMLMLTVKIPWAHSRVLVSMDTLETELSAQVVFQVVGSREIKSIEMMM